MKHMPLAATTVLALLFLLTVGAPHASADIFTFTSCHITGSTCDGSTLASGFGTVTLTQTTPDTVTFDLVLTNGNRFVETGAVAHELFLFNATSSMTVSAMTATFNGTDVTSTLGGLTMCSPPRRAFTPAAPGISPDRSNAPLQLTAMGDPL